MTGDRVAHPLLIGLANIKMSTCLKLSLNSFMLTALLPVPKFIHEKKRMCGVLEDRLIHQCLDIVLKPIKAAAHLGIMMLDPDGHNRYCFTPLAGYIADTPEAAMLAAVGGKTSPVTMAMYKQFSDSFQHEPCTRSTTLAQLHVVRSRADLQDIEVHQENVEFMIYLHQQTGTFVVRLFGKLWKQFSVYTQSECAEGLGLIKRRSGKNFRQG